VTATWSIGGGYGGKDHGHGDMGEAREKETRTPPDGFVTPAHGKIIQGDLFGQNVGGGLNHPGAYTYTYTYTLIFSAPNTAHPSSPLMMALFPLARLTYKEHGSFCP